MPEAREVKPDKWTNISILFDNGIYSIIWGYYNEGDYKVLGKRWNNSFPTQGKYPIFFVENELFTLSTLNDVVRILMVDEGRYGEKRDDHLLNTVSAIGNWAEIN